MSVLCVCNIDMDMDSETIKDKIFRYFNGKSDYATEKEIFEYISSGEKAMDSYRSLEKEWKSHNIPTILQRQSFDRITARIKARKRNRILKVSLFPAAAALALALVLTGIRTDFSSGPSQGILTTVSTGYGEKTRLVLPDSTEVWLHAATTISYSENFNRTDRVVELSGEAFFDVTHNGDLPFVVRLGDKSITVKGTRFDVAAYPSENEITAALLEGSVIFRSENAIVNLQPGEVLTYDVSNANIFRSRADVDSYAAWINGKLDYPEVTLDRLLSRLSSIYGVDFIYSPVKYADKKLRIILNGDEELSDLLDAISFIAPLEYRISGTQIYVKEL